MTDGGNINNDDKVPGLKNGGNVLFNNPWTFLPPGTTAQRPAPSSLINFRLRFNTDDQLYEYYDAILGAWTQLQESLYTAGPFVIYQADSNIPDGQNLGALADGILKQTITTGTATLDIAVPAIDYWAPGNALTRTQAPTVGDDVTNKTYVDAQISSTVTSAQGTANQVLVNGTSGTPQIGDIVLTLPQDIALTSTPEFFNLKLSNGSILDVNGNIALNILPALNAVNYVQVSNEATGNIPGMGVTGTDANVSFALKTKGQGAFSFVTANLTQPFIIYSGTTSQHITRFNFANTANDRNVTFQDADGTVAYLSNIPSVVPSALTKTDDTNVTLTLGGTPATALLQAVSLTLGWTGLLSGARGGTGVNNGSNTATFAGNLNFANSFTTSGNFAVTQTYTGATNVTFPTTGTLATTSQLPTPNALTKTDDTNVTLTLGGTPSTALLQSVSLTLGWTGLLAQSRGGTGFAAFGTGVATALQVNIGSAGAPVLFNGAGGTPSSINLTNATALPFTIKLVSISSSQTYTPTTNTKYALVGIWGGAGSAGGTAATSAAQAAAAAGGGGGGYCEILYTAAQIGASAAVVIGSGGTGASAGNNNGNAGGTSTFTPAGSGATLSAGGGSGGSGMAASGSAAVTGSTSGGSASGGTLNIAGGTGANGGTGASGAFASGGKGGSSYGSSGGSGVVSGVSASSGLAGQGPGAASSGAWAGPSQSAQGSNAGIAGLCLITEYIFT